MKRNKSAFVQILIFVLAQVAWIALLALWIYRFILNKIIFDRLGDQLSPRMISGSVSVTMLLLGCALFIAVSIGMSMIFRSFTVQNKLNRLYDTFIANITHELKSPLSSIQMYLETMLSRETPEEKRREFFNIMLKDIERLNRLINSVLEIAGLEKGARFYNYRVYKAGEIFQSLIENARRHFNLPEEALTISEDAPQNCIMDSDIFQIVIDNLIDNAIKYSSKPVKIDISIKGSTKSITIIFRDHGIGIPEKAKKQVFDKFYRITHSGAPNVRGTGLGLYLSREIIKNHKGRIELSVPSDGKGTMFIIQLPVYSDKKRKFRKMLKDIDKYEG